MVACDSQKGVHRAPKSFETTEHRAGGGFVIWRVYGNCLIATGSKSSMNITDDCPVVSGW